MQAGTRGLQGFKGDKGDPGNDYTPMIGNVETLDPALPATVSSNFDEEQNVVYFNFGIPQGIKGDTGDTNLVSFEIENGMLKAYDEQGNIYNLGMVAMEPMGEYDDETSYDRLNTVLYNDSTYMALKPSLGNLPTNTEYWQLIGGGVTKEYVEEELNDLILTVNDFGAKGDGETDDTNSINAAINFCKENKIKTLYFLDGEYVIGDTISIDFSDFALKGKGNSVLKYVGDGISGSIIEVLGTNADDYIENVVIENIKIDGTEQVYKGGYSMETPAVTHTNPAYKGLKVININFAKNIEINNCIFNDIYGDGIKIGKSTNINIINNKLYDVSSGNIQSGGQTGYDDHGDGIVSFFSYNVRFIGNTVINNRTYQDGIAGAIGKPCGRSGLEFEYPINADYTNDNPDDILHNAPDYENIPTVVDGDKNYRYGFALIMKNNYVYGYTKGIHLENRVKAIITNNTIVYNHIGIMCSIGNETLITGNYINPFKIGAAPQVGYDAYYGGIAVSQYGADSKKYGFMVNNNVFEGEGNALTIGCSHVTISNNIFKSQNCIYTLLSNLEDINILDNTFNNTNVSDFRSFLYLYNVNSCLIDSNDFYSVTPHQNEMSGNNMRIINNSFFNTFVKHNNGGHNITFINNTINADNYNNVPILIEHPTESYIANNIFYGNSDSSADNNYLLRLVSHTERSIIEFNKFYVNSTRTTAAVRNENCTDTTFNKNMLFGNGPSINFIETYKYINGCIINNTVENSAANYIRFGGNCEGNVFVDKNIGRLSAAGYKPNDSLARLADYYYDLSQKIYKYNINSSSTNIGWICVSAGWYVTRTWTTGTSYNANILVKNSNNNIYKCITKGSGNSTVEPTHTTTEDVTESDGYKWRYLGAVAVLKDLPL